MKAIKIFTYNPKNQKSDFEFYALSKGLNSGKPLDVPCSNCFVISCRNAEEKDIYSSLLFGLWKSEAFHQFFVGSVIPFIRIADFKNFVFEQMLHLQEKQKAYQQDVQTKIKELSRMLLQILRQMNSRQHTVIVLDMTELRKTKENNFNLYISKKIENETFSISIFWFINSR